MFQFLDIAAWSSSKSLALMNPQEVIETWKQHTGLKRNPSFEDLYRFYHEAAIPPKQKMMDAASKRRLLLSELDLTEEERDILENPQDYTPEEIQEVIERHKIRVRDFNPYHVKSGEHGGEFTTGGGSGSGGGESKSSGSEKLNPIVTNVGGDKWNRDTAIRLEKEYANVRSQLQTIASQAVSKNEEPSPEDEENFIPESWEELSGDKQDKVASHWKESNESAYIDSENQNWADSGGALDAAKYEVSNNFDHVGGWADLALDTMREERANNEEPGLPLTNIQILDALHIRYESTVGDGSDDPIIKFDEKALNIQIGYDPEKEPNLPGIEQPEKSEALSAKDRDEIIKVLTDAFNKEAEDKSSEMQPPEYIAESAEELLDNSWHAMSDHGKFQYAVDNDLVEKIDPKHPTGALDSLPHNYDPLQEGKNSRDYERTQKLARFVSIQRAAEIIRERGLNEESRFPAIKFDPNDKFDLSDLMNDVRKVDNEVWSEWKSSSTSFGGIILQAAAAEELGARLYTDHFPENMRDIDKLKMAADIKYTDIGGWNGLKAYVRGKWETTQYLLEKANVDEIPVYRAVNVPGADEAKKEEKVGYKQIPELVVQRNGAQSFTTTPGVSNGWDGDSNRVVVRAIVPRTAILSVPAYGINVQKEKEVVVAGTAWKGWDAWYKEAPRFEDEPIQHKMSNE